VLRDDTAAAHLRLTVHDLSDDDAERLAADVVAAARSLAPTKKVMTRP